ncbi:MAG: hypothetical protein IPO32_07575 [Crocinitomicaceae bacterium]|jgi:hypothetical protein|nr:hypothetical protein [Crocinitomicaceae bacterium]
MKNKNLFNGILVAATAILMMSCGGSGDDELQNVVVGDTTTTVTTPEQPAVEYAVPTPNELFEIIKIQGGEQRPGLVNTLDNRPNYVDLKAKSLNFGVYSADLAYMSCFGIGTEFLMYFKAIEEMGEELGISGAFDEELMERIENNEGDTDTLFAISNETYYDSYLYLEENGKGVELCLIMAGGYIESLYIICNLVDKFKEGDPIIEKIGDQKLVLENLLDFILQYSDDQLVSEVMDDLITLSDVFETSMEFEESGTSIDKTENKLVLSGGGSYKMTKNSLEKITAKAEELRANIIK